MNDVLLYVKEDQIDGVFENEDVGSGSPSFKGMATRGNRVFVATKAGGELAVVGEVPVSKVYEKSDHPEGWIFRVAAEKGTSIRYPNPVPLARVNDKLSILKGSGDIWRQIRYPRWLTPEDSGLLSQLGR